MSPNDFQTAALAAGYATRDPSNGAINIADPLALYQLAYANKVHAGTVDFAFGAISGTTARFGQANHLVPLTGDTSAHPDYVAPTSDKGSGFDGTPAAPAGPAHVYSPADPLGHPPPTDAERQAQWLDLMYRQQWVMPDDAVAIAATAALHEVSLADAERWMGLEQGAIGSAVAAEMASRGLAA